MTVCRVCGDHFRQTAGPGRHAYFCSSACRRVAKNARPRIRKPWTPVLRPCALEGCDRIATRRICETHRDRFKKFGSYELPVRPPKVRMTDCIYCGAQFECRRVHAKEQRSRKWASFRAAHPPKPLLVETRTCRDCGREFETTRRKSYCSAQCANRDARSRRRVREAGAHVEDVWRSKVYERDGYRCQLCRKPVKMSAQVPHPKAPTLDHVIPLSDGGKHCYANVQLAHFICNSRKSAGAGQLRLDIGAIA